MKSFNEGLPKESQPPPNPHDIVENFWCDSTSDECMSSTYDTCNSADIVYVTRKASFSYNIVVFNERKKLDQKVQKIPVSVDVEEIITRF